MPPSIFAFLKKLISFKGVNIGPFSKYSLKSITPLVPSSKTTSKQLIFWILVLVLQGRLARNLEIEARSRIPLLTSILKYIIFVIFTAAPSLPPQVGGFIDPLMTSSISCIIVRNSFTSIGSHRKCYCSNPGFYYFQSRMAFYKK